MRHTFAINVLLLIVVALWGSGAARALHERLEHSPAAAQAAVQTLGDDAAPARHDANDRDARHHGECETCAALAAMAAVCGILFFVLTAVGDAVVAAQRVVAQRARSICLIPAVSNRGPPSFAAARCAF